MSRSHLALVDADAGGRVALWIDIDDEDALAQRGERGAEVDGGRALADAAFLVHDRDDAARARDVLN